MKLTDTAMRYIVAVLILTVVIGFIYVNIAGKKEEEKYVQEFNTYQNAISLMQQGDFKQAVPLLKQVEAEQQDSVPIKQYLGMALVNTGEVEEAVTKYQEVVDLNPYKIEDAEFMLQFGEVLSITGKHKEAKIVLEQCQKLAAPSGIPDYQEKVNLLLAEVSKSS
ncbi:tetratricopeptide repeat protein [Domibacillus epiphyticus]|uniref:Uncharacterized protein n=1 Tax=Domibacillus epiphyticus TaxID=1714355 RepID=A0A1V2A713_9BACI|nr:tetratricopeptide repeat protein [Domibacillus epiphyticus]OMP66624.1 hypothetical protein BTO28_11310 [Domibacillus epiphyticus]